MASSPSGYTLSLLAVKNTVKGQAAKNTVEYRHIEAQTVAII